MRKDDALTQAWKYYEKGRIYNQSLPTNQYSLVNTNIEFFTGNQWLNMPDTEAMRRLPKPTFNIIKRVTSLFIASLTSTNTTIHFEPLTSKDDGIENGSTNPAAVATDEVRNLIEKFKLDYRIRDALYDGAITGDYCAHFFWNPEAVPYGGAFSPYKGEIEMELVDGINVMFGNPNCREVEKQPYILVVGRDTVASLKHEAAEFRRRNSGSTELAYEDIDLIRSDAEYTEQAGIGGRKELLNDDDLSGKALFVYMYTKVYEDVPFFNQKTGRTETRRQPVVHVTKATRSCVIFGDVSTGLTRYPIAWGNWEKQKNQYHGRALVTGIVPNQISINLMMAMTILHTELSSFPVRLYNADHIPSLTNEIGQAIGVKNLQQGESLSQLIATIPPAEMSGQILAAIDRVLAYTKECLGATDAQMGNVKPDNTSALMVLQSSSEVPLENIRAGLHEWIEDIGAILLDMMGTYYGMRPLVHDREMMEFVTDGSGMPVIDPMTGMPVTKAVTRRVVEDYDFSIFKNLWLNISTDVGATTYYSEIATVQTLDNLRRDGTLSVIDYLERLPDRLIPRKAELIDRLQRQELAAGTQPGAIAGNAAAMTAAAAAAKEGVKRTDKDSNLSRASPFIPGSPAMGGELDAAKKVAQMPTAIQARYNSLPTVAKKAILRK